ncbi:hypothetical protein DFJ77DRAFT_506817 [Powellomyces hirtus]|nr:hypothetical protein DFJ77DRAFT_506817 [Powellomyces hirtus]
MPNEIPLVVVDRILDYVWDTLVIHLDTPFYLSLLLINKAFKHAVYRRRKYLMIAQAVYLRTSDKRTKLYSLRDPFQNPYNSPLEVLALLVMGAAHDPSRQQHLGNLLRTHSQRINDLLPISDISCSMLKEGGDAYAACRVSSPNLVPATEKTYVFLKNVCGIKAQKIWEYGMLACEHVGNTAHTLYATLYLIDLDASTEACYCKMVSISHYWFPK